MQNLINKPREIKDECEIKKIAEAEKIQAKLADQGILNVSVLF